MSKIGKKNIVIPKDSSIKIEGPSLTISGPKGTKKLNINDQNTSKKLFKFSIIYLFLIFIALIVDNFLDIHL